MHSNLLMCVFLVCTGLASLVNQVNSKHYCGEELHEAMRIACLSTGFNGRSKRSVDNIIDTNSLGNYNDPNDELNPLMRALIQPNDSLMLRTRIVRQRIVETCCHQSCSQKKLREFCLYR